MEWISVKDRLPNSDAVVVLRSGGDMITAIYAGEVLSKNCFLSYYNGIFVDDVTHWMPLPEPPKPLDKPAE